MATQISITFELQMCFQLLLRASCRTHMSPGSSVCVFWRAEHRLLENDLFSLRITEVTLYAYDTWFQPWMARTSNDESNDNRENRNLRQLEKIISDYLITSVLEIATQLKIISHPQKCASRDVKMNQL
jgi:hypothetical protein